MVCSNTSSAAYKSSCQAAPHFYAARVMSPSSCQQLSLLPVFFNSLSGFSVQVPGKFSDVLSEGVFPAYQLIVRSHHSLRSELFAICDPDMAGILLVRHLGLP